MTDSRETDSREPESLIEVRVQAHQVYLSLACALFAASVIIAALRFQDSLIRYVTDMLGTGWCVALLGYLVRRSELHQTRRIDRLERTDDERYAAGYSDGYVDGVGRQTPQIDNRRLQAISSGPSSLQS